MSAFVGPADILFEPPDLFHLAGEKLVGVKKVLGVFCEKFMKKPRAMFTLVGKSLLQAAATMVGLPDLLGPMTNMVGASDLKETGPPKRPLRKKFGAFFLSPKR